MKLKSLQMPKEVMTDQSTFSKSYAKFIIEPLERGFGITLGNALRRTLLSSIQGAAPVSLRIEGVLHEFSTIPGVYEDVTEIVLNIKKLRVKLIGDGPKTVTLDAQKKKEYKAGDLKADPEVEILNPEQHLVTLTDENKLKLEIEIGCGRGYVTAEQNRKPEAAVGTIFLDSFFLRLPR